MMSPPTIPTRFESLISQEGFEPQELIVAVEADLRAFDRLRRIASVKGGGVLAFLLGPSGTGKTTAVYSASTHLSAEFEPVFSVPGDVELRNLPEWITGHLPPSSGRCRLVLLDARESTDDSPGLVQLLTRLNVLLRTRPDTIVCWPTTDDSWHQQLKQAAQKIGGTSLAPPEADIYVSGPAKEQWRSILDRLLVLCHETLAGLGIEEQSIQALVNGANRVGDFLADVGRVVAEQTTEVRLLKKLPHLLFVVSSDRSLLAQAHQIRHTTEWRLDAARLHSASLRSKAGRFWTGRSALPKIVTLFEARLVTLTPSSVVYACLQHGDSDLQQAVKIVRPHPTNAVTTMKATEFFRWLGNLPATEMTSAPKGKTKDATNQAYTEIQKLSAKKHKAINSAICAMAQECVPGLGDTTIERVLAARLRDAEGHEFVS
jgi:hypothetical protein